MEFGTFSNVLVPATIDVNYEYSGVIFHTPSNSSHRLKITLPTIKLRGAKLIDDQNRLVETDGMDWQISIQIDFVKRLQTLNIINHKQLIGCS